MAHISKRGEKGWYTIVYRDRNGRRRSKGTKTTDKRVAARIAAKLEGDEALRREGIIDARTDRFSSEGRRPLADHVEEYLNHCRNEGQSEKHLVEKVRHLKRLQENADIKCLAELTPEVLEQHLTYLEDKGLSARSINFCRQVVLAFANWCVKRGRLESNTLQSVARRDETKDRRHKRRPLTDDEMSRLLAVAEAGGRKAWYMVAALAGLRRSDLQRLTWGDIDFMNMSITIRGGKSKRTDTIPLHPQLADELRRCKPTHVLPRARVFPTSVTNLTTQKDFYRAGMGWREEYRDKKGKKYYRYYTEDSDGWVIDLHALRTTLGTTLAREGVPPQLAQRIMRHQDFRTTLKHYTVLGLSDTARGMEKVPAIRPHDQSIELDIATGTGDSSSPKSAVQTAVSQGTKSRETMQSDASDPNDNEPPTPPPRKSQPTTNADSCKTARACAKVSPDKAGITQLVECQLPKLNVAGSSPVARSNAIPPAAIWLPVLFSLPQRGRLPPLQDFANRTRPTPSTPRQFPRRHNRLFFYLFQKM